MTKRSKYYNVDVGDLVEYSFYPMNGDWEHFNERTLTGMVLDIVKEEYFLNSMSFETCQRRCAKVHWFKADKDQRHLDDDDPNKTLTYYEDEKDFEKHFWCVSDLIPLSNLVILHKN